MVQVLKTADEVEQYLKKGRYALLYCVTDWCGPCHYFRPIVTEVHEDWYARRMPLYEVNIDELGHLAKLYKVKKVPTLFVMYGKKNIERIEGKLSKEQLEELLAGILE